MTRPRRTHQPPRAVNRHLRRPQRAVAVHPFQLPVLDLHGHEGPEVCIPAALAEGAVALGVVAAEWPVKGGGCDRLLREESGVATGQRLGPVWAGVQVDFEEGSYRLGVGLR